MSRPAGGADGRWCQAEPRNSRLTAQPANLTLMYESHSIPRRFSARILVSIRLCMACLGTLFWMRTSFWTCVSIWMCTSIGAPVFAAPDQNDSVELFERKIRPALIRYCYECHSAAATEIKGGLRLDSREALLQGGTTGPAVVPGDVEGSLLISAIRRQSLEMPPDEKLPPTVIDDFAQWVAEGAPDPRDDPPTVDEATEIAWQGILESRRDWWSFKPLCKPQLPAAESKSSSDAIDYFVEARLAAAGLELHEPADLHTLLRRLTFVLTGLPPTSEEVHEFERQSAHHPAAYQNAVYEALVDRLLGSPHFGERWARHWMDVVRFAETHGYEWNHEIRDAWRYRDYLIRAFNADLPYDQLVREHIAGDLLKAPRINTTLGINESVIGTAFWRFSELGHDNCTIFPEIRFDALDNQIDTLTKGFQALTVSCARCHNHKLDAISTADYYALVGILESSRQVVQTLDLPGTMTRQANQLKNIKSKLQLQLATKWLAAIEALPTALLTALRQEKADGEEKAGTGLQQQLHQENPELDNFTLSFKRIADLQEPADLSLSWQQLKQEYETEAHKRTKFNAENFHPYQVFSRNQPHTWKTLGLGLQEGPGAAGRFVLATGGDNMVNAVLPAGIFTHLLSPRMNGTLQSPWLPTEHKYVSLQFLGDGLSMVRAVVDSCALNEYAGGGKLYLDGDGLRWKRFPTSAGSPHRSYLELTTKTDNLRWPDRPGVPKTTDDAKLQSPHSWFGVTHVVLHDCEETPRPELSHLARLFDQPPPKSLNDVAKAYQRVCQQAIEAWRDGRATNDDVHWINWLLSSELLPNSISSVHSAAGLVRQYREIEACLSQARVVAGIADHGPGFDSPLLLRGNATDLGPEVPRRYLEAIAGSRHFPSKGSGRWEIAELITSEENPLTARVMVNRIWHHLFGTGIIRTTDNFGHVGDLPSHPMLLDYLAHQFMQEGWSVKKLIRQIVTSRTFRQSNSPTAAAIEQDPANRLLHHYPVRRLDSEAIRDTILAVSGRLDQTLYGPSIHPYRETPKEHRKLAAGPLDGAGRRSLYLKVTRMEGSKFLELFDRPNPMETRGSRNRTNVPAQALALLNDPFLIDQSRFWSQQLLADQNESPEARIENMFVRALGRPPADEERDRIVTFVHWLEKYHEVTPNESLANPIIWQEVAHWFFNTKELIYIR